MKHKDQFVGVVFTGFSEEWFENDSYLDKTIVANGDDWFVAEDKNRQRWFLEFEDIEDMEFFIKKWSEAKQ